eukprot:13512609-Heterocapsa_arctica.AAC.1
MATSMATMKARQSSGLHGHLASRPGSAGGSKQHQAGARSMITYTMTHARARPSADLYYLLLILGVLQFLAFGAGCITRRC